MSLIAWLNAASTALEKSGKEDAAFYFEMAEEFFRNEYKGGGLDFRHRDIGL